MIMNHPDWLVGWLPSLWDSYCHFLPIDSSLTPMDMIFMSSYEGSGPDPRGVILK
jgi:hypothetical protein